MKHTPLSQPGASPELLTTYTPIALTPASLSVFGLRFCCLCLAVLGNLCSMTSSKTWLRYQKPLLPWLFTISTFPRLHPAASLDPARSITSSCSAILQLVQRFISRRIMVFCFSPSLTTCNILFTFLDCCCKLGGSLERTGHGDSRTLTAGFHHQDYFSYLCYFAYSNSGFQLLFKIPRQLLFFSTLNNFISANSVTLLFTMHSAGACTALWSSTGNNLGTADTIFHVVMSC